MEKIQEMVRAMAKAATEYREEHDLTNSDVMNALAHTYVIYGFTVKNENTSDKVLKDALVVLVSSSCDFMMEVSANAEKA